MANLTSVDLSDKDLTGAIFDRTDLTDTNFDNAMLTRAIFLDTKIDNANIDCIDNDICTP